MYTDEMRLSILLGKAGVRGEMFENVFERFFACKEQVHFANKKRSRHAAPIFTHITLLLSLVSLGQATFSFHFLRKQVIDRSDCFSLESWGERVH